MIAPRRTPLVALLLALSCASTEPAPTPEAELAKLALWMTGTFSSAAQAQARPGEYLDLRLVTARIWPERSDGPWLYTEQALATDPDHPVRQRVHRLVARTGQFDCELYTLPGNPQHYAGAWRTPAVFAALTPTELEAHRGCTLKLHATDAATFLGQSDATDCPLARLGSAYATLEVAITEFGLTSWERGFDATGRHAWGARLGPYCFDKVAETPPE